MKTGFQSSIKKSAGNRHPFYEIVGPFWGPFSSKKSVVCWSKTSLIWGPLKIVILTPSGHPKSTKCEVLVWCRFGKFSRWWGLRSWRYFSSSAVAVLVSISKFKHIYASELQLSKGLQDSKNVGLKMRSKIALNKLFQRVPNAPQK